MGPSLKISAASSASCDIASFFPRVSEQRAELTLKQGIAHATVSGNSREALRDAEAWVSETMNAVFPCEFTLNPSKSRLLFRGMEVKFNHLNTVGRSGNASRGSRMPKTTSVRVPHELAGTPRPRID